MHIQDAPFYETFYRLASQKPTSKLKQFEGRLNNPTSSFATSDPHFHRIRRGALNPFFSKRKIVERGPLIQAHVNEICQRLRTEFQDTGRVLNVSDLFGCLTADVVVEYCFERRYNYVREMDFKAAFMDALIELLDNIHWNTQFPWVIKALQMLPESIVGWLNPPLKTMLDFNRASCRRPCSVEMPHVNIKLTAYRKS